MINPVFMNILIKHTTLRTSMKGCFILVHCQHTAQPTSYVISKRFPFVNKIIYNHPNIAYRG